MKINICNVGTKEWLDFKADISYGLFYSLIDLGHDVTMSINHFDSNRLNLVIGADFLAENEKNVQEIIESNIEYFIYEVENFDGLTINNRKDFNIQNYKKFIEGAKFVITPYALNMKAYRDQFDADKIRYCRWGFHPKMKDSNIERSDLFEFDSLFFGMIKGDRLRKVKALINNYNISLKLLATDAPVLFKSYYTSKCRWGLNLSYGKAEKFINPFRLYYMVANGMPVLADGGNDDDGYLNICKVVEFSEFSEQIKSTENHANVALEMCSANRLIENLKLVI